MTAPPMHVLNLVTNDSARCFTEQVDTLRERGIASTTLSVPGDRKWASADGDGTRRSLFDYLRWYPTVLRHTFGSYDLVHANYGLTAPAAIAQIELPIVISLWGSDLFGQFGQVSRVCAHVADAVIVMSQRMAAALDVECHVIPHGVNLDAFEPQPQDVALTEVEWDTDQHNVLFPYPPARDVKDYPRAERVVAAVDRRLDSPVELQVLSGVPFEEMPRYFNAADALLLTSKHEGSPNTVKEALACNLPVVSTDVGDVRERLDGVAPSSVCRTDAELVDALTDVLERGTRSNGRKAAREVGLEQMGRDIEQVYRSVLGRT